MQKKRNVDFISVDPSPPGVLLELKATVLGEMANPGRVSDSTDQGHIVVCPFHRSGSWLSRRIRSVRLLILFVMLCIGSVGAQDIGQAGLGGVSMENLAKMKVDPVYAASKFLQKAEDAATWKTVVTAEGIRKYGYRTFTDVLRSVRGFYVINDRNSS